MNDVKAIGAFLTTAAAIPGALSIPIVTSAPGVLGVLGFTTTATVVLPFAGMAAAAGVISYGVYKGVQAAQGN